MMTPVNNDSPDSINTNTNTPLYPTRLITVIRSSVASTIAHSQKRRSRYWYTNTHNTRPASENEVIDYYQ